MPISNTEFYCYPTKSSSVGYGEKAGSGADVITKGCEDNHWPTPLLTERVQPEETQMTLTIVSIDELRNSSEKKLNSSEKKQKSSEKKLKSSEKKQKSSEKKLNSSEKKLNSSEKKQKSSEKTLEKMLEMMRNDPHVTIADMAISIGMSQRAIEKSAKRLREMGKVFRKGGRRTGEWEIVAN